MHHKSDFALDRYRPRREPAAAAGPQELLLPWQLILISRASNQAAAAAAGEKVRLFRDLDASKDAGCRCAAAKYRFTLDRHPASVRR
jgi:hypothetical protein